MRWLIYPPNTYSGVIKFHITFMLLSLLSAFVAVVIAHFESPYNCVKTKKKREN